MMKSAFVSIIGRPSSGKSTFLNKVCENKISIVSNVPQTTRNRIRGIWNDKEKKGQLVFIDTPGFHISSKKFNTYMRKSIHSAIRDCDLVLYLIDVTQKPGEEERTIMNILKNQKKPILIVLNKIDKGTPLKKAIKAELNSIFNNTHIFEISALRGNGLSSVLEKLLSIAPCGERMYPEDFYTDQAPEFRIAEIIREKAINATKQELPHSIYVDILDIELQQEDNLLWVRGFIYVERDSQKGILIGKKGDKIKKILKEAYDEIITLFPYTLELDIRIKVNPKWRQNERFIKKIIK